MEENMNVKDYYENKYDESKRNERETLEFTRSKIIISRYLTNSVMEIADICGATGAYSFWLADMGHKVHLLDLAQNHIDSAKQYSIDSGVSLASYSCADARSLPYCDDSMDLVLLMGALYHLRSPESRIKCLNEAFRVLKHGGIILSTVMNRYNTITAALKYNIIDTFGGMDAIEKILLTGIVESASIPQSYCHMPDEIKNELLSAGFMDIHLVSVEGIANATSDNTLPKNEKNIELLLRCIELTESVPELLGVSRNIIAVGKKPLY